MLEEFHYTSRESSLDMAESGIEVGVMSQGFSDAVLAAVPSAREGALDSFIIYLIVQKDYRSARHIDVRMALQQLRCKKKIQSRKVGSLDIYWVEKGPALAPSVRPTQVGSIAID